MYLRADGISLYFPADGVATGSKHGPEAARVGGSIIDYRGKPYVRALDDVSLSLERGARLGIVGHNGSGKSTLLRTLAGLYTPQRGSIKAGGTVSGIFNMSIGFRQEATGYRNIVLKGLMAGRSKREIETAIPSIADFTGLGRYLDMPLRTYSQGMALRLAFAITTTFPHDILIMDEWIGAGDMEFQGKVIERMNSMLESAHICVLASHNSSLLRQVTENCLWLDNGRVRAYGPTEDVLAQHDIESVGRRQIAKLAVQSRLPIPENVDVLEILRPDQSGELAPTLRWNLQRFNVQRVRLTVTMPGSAEEKLVGTAPGTGTRALEKWVRAGAHFRLFDNLDNSLLGSIVLSDEDLD